MKALRKYFHHQATFKRTVKKLRRDLQKAGDKLNRHI